MASDSHAVLPPPAHGREVRGYEEYYGLEEAPFTLSSDPKFFYHSTPHDLVAQQLLTAIRNREGLVVITGAVGTGKTMLCQAVVEQLDRRTLTSLVTDPTVSTEELLKTVLVDFGVMSREELARGPLAAPRDLHDALRSFLTTLAPLEATAVVIIDEAQTLPPEVLEQVRSLAEAGIESGLLQIVLVGPPSLTTVLGRPEYAALNQRVTVRLELSPLPQDEIDSYVNHRLAAAERTPHVRFDHEALDYVFRLSHGVPRVVNLLCDRALARGCAASATEIGIDLIEKAAEDLDIGLPPSRVKGALKAAGAIVSFLLLMLVGAAAAAWLFHDAFARGIARWEMVPAPVPPQGPVRN